jgi:glycosyltransferase involved in cell wall biosynthesis
VITRLDGPVSAVRGEGLEIDKMFFSFIRTVADGVIYQSSWSKDACVRLGRKYKGFVRTITNAADPSIFNREGKTPFRRDRKVRLIANSWSSNWRKGFNVYQWLDQHLDFSRYELVFIGNAPVIFDNIRQIPPLSSDELANELKQSDIYITASQKEPCSNSLVEALQCGLPAIVLNDGGHPEIVGKGGEVFDIPEQIFELLDRITANYEDYVRNIQLPTLNTISDEYYGFMKFLHEKVRAGEYIPKKSSRYSLFMLNLSMWWCRLCPRLRAYKMTLKNRLGYAKAKQ